MKKSSVKKAIVILVMSLIVPMLLMGCSQKSESLRIGTSFSIVGGSPWSPFVNIGQNGLHQLIYDSLFVIDEHGFPIPGIVNDYDQKQLNYNLTIREGVLFHDGTELTAADVADTLLRLIKLHGNSNREAIKRFSKLEKIEVLGKYQLQFQLKEPDMFFLNTLTFGITPAYNPEHKDVKQWPVSFST
jgi:peptide/nickel transport system substrate-binding protein